MESLGVSPAVGGAVGGASVPPNLPPRLRGPGGLVRRRRGLARPSKRAGAGLYSLGAASLRCSGAALRVGLLAGCDLLCLQRSRAGRWGVCDESLPRVAPAARGAATWRRRESAPMQPAAPEEAAVCL